MSYDLWNLLPGHQRVADAERGYPLRALLDIISRQANALDDDISGLYNDLFIETCDERMIPYLGALIGNIQLRPVPGGARADVARTVYFRRRKGTVAMLGELGGFVTGHPVHAVAFFDTLSISQNLNHPRPGIGTADLRSGPALGHLDTGFNTLAHTADMRPWAAGGRFAIPKVGFFISRLGSYQLNGATARPVPGHPGFHTFSPLGQQAPLFTSGDAPAPASTPGPSVQDPEPALAGPLRHDMFHFGLPDYYPQPGTGLETGGLGVSIEGVPLNPQQVACMNLSTWAVPEQAGISAGIDVERGLISLAAALVDPAHPAGVETNHAYGFTADLGGGPYQRPRLYATGAALEQPRTLDLLPGGIGASLAAWNPAAGDAALLEIPDSSTRVETGVLELGGPGRRLEVRAAQRRRPLLVANLLAGTGCPEHLVLDGLLIEGRLEVAAGSRLLSLELNDCTLVPGGSLDTAGEPVDAQAPSLLVGPGNGQLAITLNRCITGPLVIPDSIDSFTATDTVIDHPLRGPGAPGYALSGSAGGSEPGAPATLQRCTVFGAVHVRELVGASDCLFMGQVDSERRQHGCVRFSYLSPGSVTAGGYRCQPDTALEALAALTPGADPGPEELRVRPAFTSLRYGQPGYGQLAPPTAQEITTGASNRSEMGAFNLVHEPQRAANLETRLEEYLPFGLEPGFINIT